MITLIKVYYASVINDCRCHFAPVVPATVASGHFEIVTKAGQEYNPNGRKAFDGHLHTESTFR